MDSTAGPVERVIASWRASASFEGHSFVGDQSYSLAEESERSKVLDASHTIEIFVDDPTSGERHRFVGRTDAEALRAVEIFFGVDEAEASNRGDQG